MANFVDIIILSIVEGVTEFLPVSSTGHMIITRDLLGLENNESLSAFLVIVQAGAILAVISAFLKVFKNWLVAWINVTNKSETFVDARRQSLSIAMSVIPFAIVGFLFKDFIKSLFSVSVVAYALIVGGVLIVVVEQLLARRQNKEEKKFESVTLKDCVIIGVGQCLALWPGFSRSAATILTARARGYSRPASAELSFLIGMPALLGTASYEAIKEWHLLPSEWHTYLLVGIVISWAVAYVCVKGFVAFLQKFSLSWFAAYRIIVGVLILLYMVP